MMRSAALLFLFVLAGAEIAAAQSIFARSGLGVPVSPVDARARALGGIGIGLRSQNPSLINPAEVADYRYRGVSAVLQSSNRAIALDGVQADAGASRFPLLRIVYPLSSGVVLSAGYGGFLDQTWSAFTDRTTTIGSDDVEYRDLIDSSGGITQVQVGAAYPLTPDLAIGVGGGIYSGDLERIVSRDFSTVTVGEIADFTTRLAWSEQAPFATAGLRWDPSDILRFGASMTWAGTLEAKAESDAAEDFSVELPLQVAGGASVLLAPRLLAVVSSRWAGWSSAADAFSATNAPDDTWELGGGIEWGGPTFGDRALPVRLGYHYSEYPFRINGELPSERAIGAGIGLRFGLAEAGPVASIDAALERGSREAGSAALSEDFWRFTASLAVFGR